MPRNLTALDWAFGIAIFLACILTLWLVMLGGLL